MTLRVALTIDGDSSGAKKAADDASRAVGDLQRKVTGGVGPNAAAIGVTRQLAGANDNLTRSLQGASGALAVMPGPLGQVGSGLGIVALGIGAVSTAAIGMAVAVGSKAVEAYRQLEKEQATYNGVIRATGMAAGRTGDDIEGLATDIRKASTATEGEVRSAAAVLLTFRSVAGDAFDETLKLSQDLAAVGFGSITSAATMMGKALEDPERGLLALKRVGVSFSETQQQVIKNFIETGQRGKAQQLILEGVRQQVGGAGAAQGNTLVGATNQLGEATNNLLERWGAQITKALGLRAAILGVAEAIDRTNKAAEEKASPEGQLATARAELERLRSNPNAGRQRVGTPRDAAIGLAEEKVKAAEAALALDSYGKAHERVIASLSAWVAAEDAMRERFEGVVGKIKEDTDELRKNALQREINKELKKAEIDVTTAEGQARAKALGVAVRERFELANGTQMIQARVAALGSAATEAEKLAAKQAELNQALREGTLRDKKDYDRALAGAQLDSLISAESRRIGVLEDLARVEDVVANKQREINQLRSQGIAISEAEERAILSRTRIQADAQRLESQLLFERAQLGRTETEQRIAQELRSRGIDPASADGERYADMIRVNEQLKISKGLMEDFVMGGWRDFKNELKQGATAWQAFQHAGVNALDRLSDKLMDMALQQAMTKAFGGFNIFSLLGLGGAGAGSPGTIGGTGGGLGGLYDTGGYTGDIDRHRIAGVVHGREFVVNADATARHYPLLKALNDNRMPGYASGGMVGPPPRAFGGGGMGWPTSVNNQIVVEDHSGGGVRVQDEPAPGGGRRTRIVVDEMVAGGIRQGSPGHRALLDSLGARQRPRRRE